MGDEWKPGDERCDRCDNGVLPDWCYCAFCGHWLDRPFDNGPPYDTPSPSMETAMVDLTTLLERGGTVLVCGGRDLDTEATRHELERIAIKHFPRTETDEYGNYLFDVKIISGGAPGADTAAIDWAVVNWCEFKEFKADWNRHGRAAGPIRNQQMLDEGRPALVVAFPGGRGTADMVERAEKAGVKVLRALIAKDTDNG